MQDIHTLDGKHFVPGRIVIYRDQDGKRFPMLLTACFKSATGQHRANGVLFGPFVTKYIEQVRYDQAQSSDSWSWPPTVKKNPVATGKPQPGKPLYSPPINRDAPSPRSVQPDRKRGSR